jgi:hypothetical protein
MYMIPFCLLAVISGWVAWRDNPLFSARSTLRFLVAVGGTLAVVIFAIIQATRFTDHHSQAAGFTMIGAVILFSSIAMIWAIVLVSTPKSSPLPANTKMLHLNRHRVSRFAARAGWVTLAWAVLTVALHGTPRIILGTIGGLFVFIGLVLWFAAYITARHADRCLSIIEANPWLHWTYTPGQWQQWVSTEVARTPTAQTFQWRRDWHKLAWPILAIAIGVLIFSPGSLFFRAAYVLGIALFFVVIIILGQRGDKSAPQRTFAKLSKVAPEAYFGEEGIFADGEFTPWLTVGVFLLSASMDDREPRSLVLCFSRSTANQISAVNLSLPLPTGDHIAADLATLQQHLTTRCPTATINLT